MKRTLVLCVAIASVSLAAVGTVSLGGLFTTGNSKIEQVDAAFQLTGIPTSGLAAELTIASSYGSQDEVTFREKYLTEGSLKYSLTETNYITGRSYWTRDEFSGINREYGASAGFGHDLVSNESLTAGIEAGSGFFSRENTEETVLETSTWYTKAALLWQPGQSWTFSETATYTGDFQDSDNYFIGSVLEAQSAITGNLSFVMGYDITLYNKPPVEGNEKTDTSLRVQLRLAFQ